MMRYIRAFFQALAMTIRGEKPLSAGERRYPQLAGWLQTAQTNVDAVYRALEQANMDMRARRQTTVKVDGRETNIDALLGTVRYHLHEEYPYMLRHLTEHSLTGIYASNLNDQYWLAKILEAATLPDPVVVPLQTLQEHLTAIPPSSTPSD
jgi:hypothetical protein